MILDKIYCPEEQRERADKALRLNGFTGPLLPKTRAKPTIRIKRLSFSGNGPGIKLKGASSTKEEREKADKALRLNGLV